MRKICLHRFKAPIRSTLGVAILLAGIAPASAHEMWLGVEAGRVEVRYGHPGDLSLPEKARLYELSATGGSGKAAVPRDRFEVAGGRLSVPLPAGASMVAARYDNGFWVKTADGYRNTSRHNLPDNLSSVWSEKYAKLLLDGAGSTRPAGHRLELVPLTDPYGLKPGEKLRLRVDYAGKPLAGAKVEIGDGKTEADPPLTVTADSRGIVAVDLLPGETVLLVEHQGPGSFPNLADKDQMAAALTIIRP